MTYRRHVPFLAVFLLSAAAIGQQQPAAAANQTPDVPVPSSAPPPTDQAAPDTSAGGRKPMQEELTVTGSRIRRKDLTTPAPVTVVTRQQFEESGRLTIGDFLQTLPEQGNAPNFQLNTGGVNYGADGTTRINLRNLGVQRTLVLINGRRVVPGGLGASAAVDLNTIPTEAVDRIEVLKEGASAIYGSDAVAGVVNVITRRNFSGTNLGAQYGVSGHGDAQTFDAHATTGHSDENTSALFSVRYFNQKDSWLRDRSWAQQALDYSYDSAGCSPGSSRCVVPGGSSRTPEGTIRMPQDPNTGQPVCNGNPLCEQMVAYANANGGWKPSTNFIRDPSGPVCGNNGLNQKECFRLFGTAAPANNLTGNDAYNFAADNYLTIPSQTIQAWSSGDAKFSPARVYYEASYTSRTSTQNAAPMPLNPADYNNIVVSKDNVYNPFGTDINFLGRRLVEFGNRTYSEALGNFRVVTGVDGTLPSSTGPLEGWYWDVYGNYGRTEGTFTTGGSFRNSRVAAAVGPSFRDATGAVHCGTAGNVIDGCTPLNLLGGPGSILPSQQDFLGFSGTSRAYDMLFTVAANTEGELFRMGADRPVSLAMGYEYRFQEGSQIADPIVQAGDSADFNFKTTKGHFYSNEAYAELSLPILANVPFVDALEATAAGRYVNYSTFGGNFSYKLGARYTPVRDFTVRATYSTAFRAPSISELYLGGNETDPAATDPCVDLTNVPADVAQRCRANGVKGSGSADTGVQELTRQSGNTNLQAETAKSYTAGIVVQPSMVRGLSITVDYFHTAIDNAIGFISTPYILQGCFIGGYQPFCSQVNRNNSGAIQFVSSSPTNQGQLTTAGVDFAVRYSIPTEMGRFAFSLDGSWLAFLDSAVTVGGLPTVHGKGYYDLGALPAWKGNLGIDYGIGGFVAGAVGRYVASFTQCSNPYDPTTAQGGLCNLTDGTINPLNQSISSFFQLDLHAGYTLTTTYGRTNFFVGMTNALDKAPPYIYSANLANSDPATYDYLGRYVYGRVSHTF